MRVYKVEIIFPENVTEYFFYRPLFMDCYLGFKLNLVRRYGILGKTPYKITWLDNEGDRIRIFNEEDWLTLIELNGTKVIVEVGYEGIPAKNSIILTKDDQMMPSEREFSKKCILCYEDVNEKEIENKDSNQLVQNDAIKSNIPQQESAGENQNIFDFSPRLSYSVQPRKQSPVTATKSKRPVSIGNGNLSNVTTMYTPGKESKKSAMKPFRRVSFDLTATKVVEMESNNDIVEHNDIENADIAKLTKQTFPIVPSKDVLGHYDLMSPPLNSPFISNSKPYFNHTVPLAVPVNGTVDDNKSVDYTKRSKSYLLTDLKWNGMEWIRTTAPQPECQYLEPQTAILDYFSPMQKTENIVHHDDPEINDAVIAMISMGYANDGGYLSHLLEKVKGDISEAIAILEPIE